MRGDARRDGRAARRGTALRGALVAFAVPVVLAAQQNYTGADGRLRVALVKQPFLPDGQSKGPATMADGGIQSLLTSMGALVRVDSVGLTAEENTEYGGWKRLGMALGHFGAIVAQSERAGWFTIGLLATCPELHPISWTPYSL